MARTFVSTNSDYFGRTYTGTLHYTEPVAISFWFRGTSDATQSLMAIDDNPSAGSKYWRIWIGNGVTGTLTNELVTLGYNGNIFGYTTATRTNLLNDAWRHVLVTSDNSVWRLYIDGVQRALTVGSGSNTGQWEPITDAGWWVIGARSTSAEGDGTYLNAKLAQFSLHDIDYKDYASMFAAGVPAIIIRPGSCKAYWPMYGQQSPERDWIAGDNLTVNGPDDTGEHPPIHGHQHHLLMAA